MFENITYQKENKKVTITLNRPKVFNALNAAILKELHEAFEIIKLDKNIRVVVLTGIGNTAFCSGADLKAGLSDTNLGNTLKLYYNPLILGMRSLPIPIICRLNGVAAGAGMSLALACDVIIADENTYMSELFVGIGLVPDAGSMFFLPRMVGSLKAFELCSTGRKVYMKEALEIGLVNKVVKTEDLDKNVMELATYYENAATFSIGQMKAVLNQTFEKSLSEILAMEAESQTSCGYSEDFSEGVMSFILKKEPAFKGK